MLKKFNILSFTAVMSTLTGVPVEAQWLPKVRYQKWTADNGYVISVHRPEMQGPDGRFYPIESTRYFGPNQLCKAVGLSNTGTYDFGSSIPMKARSGTRSMQFTGTTAQRYKLGDAKEIMEILFCDSRGVLKTSVNRNFKKATRVAQGVRLELPFFNYSSPRYPNRKLLLGAVNASEVCKFFGFHDSVEYTESQYPRSNLLGSGLITAASSDHGFGLNGRADFETVYPIRALKSVVCRVAPLL